MSMSVSMRTPRFASLEMFQAVGRAQHAVDEAQHKQQVETFFNTLSQQVLVDTTIGDQKFHITALDLLQAMVDLSNQGVYRDHREFQDDVSKKIVKALPKNLQSSVEGTAMNMTMKDYTYFFEYRPINTQKDLVPGNQCVAPTRLTKDVLARSREGVNILA